MGTKIRPNYANLFVGYVEEQIFNQFNGLKPELFEYYINGATFCTKEELERFIGFVNSQFLRLCRLCSDDSDFNSKCDEMSSFFSKRGYPDNIL